MKKIILIILIILSTINIYGQWNEQGTLTVKGNMPLITELKIEDNNVELDLSQSQTDIHIASIFERSNSLSGYSVSVSSSNSGELISTETSDNVSYSLTYDGSELDLSGGSVTANSNNERTNMGGIERELLISHSGSEDDLLLSEGNYEDDLTFTIEVQ